MSGVFQCLRPARNTAGPLAVANGLTAGSIYLLQALVVPAAREDGASFFAQLAPGATLAGYAAGVALCASLVSDLTSRRGLGLHLLWLALSLCLAAAAPNAEGQALACLCVGFGCSLTQRLLALAGNVPDRDRAKSIGALIAAGLAGIVAVRALLPLALCAGSPRALLFADVCAIALTTSLVLRAIPASSPPASSPLASSPLASSPPVSSPVVQRALPSAVALWRDHSSLRRAALQQALAFAAYNLAWTRLLHVMAAQGASAGLQFGAIASVGAIAAVITGRLCGRRSPQNIAGYGTAVIALGACLAVLLSALHQPWAAAVALIDIGTQVALVSNQARAQALAATSALRGRFAAIVTTVGFAGGAFGAAIGSLLV